LDIYSILFSLIETQICKDSTSDIFLKNCPELIRHLQIILNNCVECKNEGPAKTEEFFVQVLNKFTNYVFFKRATVTKV